MTDNSLDRRGVLFVLSSPSGAGKSTIARMLLRADGDIAMSISVTTRPMRPGEVDGRDYHFVDVARFKEMVAAGDLMEWAHVFDQRYGTPRAPVEAMLAHGRDVLFDIDWQGAQQLFQQAGGDVVRVFILPPSMPDLARRLYARAQDSDETIQRRLMRAPGEIAHWGEYDYVVVNDDFDRAYADLFHIYRAERLKRARQPWLAGFVKGLLRPDSSPLGGEEGARARRA